MILICQWEVSGEIASGVKCNDLLSSVPLDPLGRCHHKRSRSVIALTIFQIMIFQIAAWLRGPHSPHRFHWAGPGPGSGEWREWWSMICPNWAQLHGAGHIGTWRPWHNFISEIISSNWHSDQQSSSESFLYVTAILYPRNSLVVV